MLSSKVPFLKIAMTLSLCAASVLNALTLKEGVDEVHAGKGVLYFSRLIAKATQSKISRIVSLPIYQEMTIRNWNTTTQLLNLIEKSSLVS